MDSQNVKKDESDKNNKNYKNDINENNEKNEKIEGGKKDMKNCCCELFCGPSRPSQTCCNVDELKLICKRCCCDMNDRVEAISIPENVAEMMADKMADKVMVKMEERSVAFKHAVNSVETEVEERAVALKHAVNSVETEVEERAVALKHAVNSVETEVEERAVALKHAVNSVETEGAADEDANSKVKGSIDGDVKKKLSISPDFDTKSTTSKKGDAEDEKKVHRIKAKRYSIYSAKLDAEGNPINISESRRKTRSVSGDGEADETPAEFDAKVKPIKIPKSKRKKRSVSGDGVANATPISKTSNNADKTIKTSNDRDVEEKPKPGSKSILRTSSGTNEASKSTESEPDGELKLRPLTNFNETTKFIEESEAEDKTNKTREKIKNRRTTKMAHSETTTNNDDSKADDNAEQSIVEEMASSVTMVLKTDCDRLSKSCCIERPSSCICMCTPCICPDKKSPINGGASSNERLHPNGNCGNGMQSFVEENTETATAALQTACDRHSKACYFERSPFCVCMCTPCICPKKHSPKNEPSKLTNVESNAEKRDSELIGEIRESMAAVVKDNLDKNFGNYFSCCFAKIEELSYRTERQIEELTYRTEHNEYLLRKMHKDLKLRIGILDRFMTQCNDNNDDCECECTCEYNKGHSVSGGK